MVGKLTPQSLLQCTMHAGLCSRLCCRWLTCKWPPAAAAVQSALLVRSSSRLCGPSTSLSHCSTEIWPPATAAATADSSYVQGGRCCCSHCNTATCGNGRQDPAQTSLGTACDDGNINLQLPLTDSDTAPHTEMHDVRSAAADIKIQISECKFSVQGRALCCILFEQHGLQETEVSCVATFYLQAHHAHLPCSCCSCTYGGAVKARAALHLQPAQRLKAA